jgi:streptogramin lyase
MSDFVTGLRQDLVEAAELERRRGPAARIGRTLRPRAWSPSALAGAVAATAAVVAVVLTLSAVAPPPKPSSAKVVATIRVGGQPRDAALAAGSLWIADFEGRVVRLDPATRRVRARINVGGTAEAVAGGGDVVWVLSNDDANGGSRSHLTKLDARNGRVLARVPVNGSGGLVEVGAGGLWLVPDSPHSSNLERIDPDSFERTAYVVLPDRPTPGLADGLSVSGASVWTQLRGTLLEIDAASGRIVTRVPGVGPAHEHEVRRTVLARRDEVWTVASTVGLLMRVENGRVTQRITVGAAAGVVARTASAVWVAASTGADDGNEVVRVDPDDGSVLQRIHLGFEVPQALVPVGTDLWVITSGGEALRISPAG